MFPTRLSTSHPVLSVSAAALVTLLAAAPALSAQQTPGGNVVLDSAVLSAYSWRNIGPDRGGRSIAVTGVRHQPKVAYFGATGGGLWKTTDAGENWAPVTDGQITSASVGAVAVSETDPNVVYIGTGESAIRGDIMPGDGIYKSTDAGKTWTHIGFDNVDAISKIRVDPTNPDIVYAAVFGQYSVASPDRGVFKSTDGGKTWKKVLFRNDSTGAVDISIDRNNPQVVYAALWQAYRTEYTMSSGGVGSGLFKSTDGGEHWTEITRNPGLPQKGLVGRIGVAVSRANSNRVYALVENDNGGLFKSDDGGAHWQLMNDSHDIRQRAFYYTDVFADPKNEDVVYMENTSLFRSTDAGKTLHRVSGTHGDFHDLWIDPDDPTHMVVGNDGGGAVTTNTGRTWTDEDFPTGQFYHVATTTKIPYDVCGAQQDNSTLCLPYDWNERGGRGFFGGGGGGRGGRGGSRDITAGGMAVAYQVSGGEPGYIAPDPEDFDIFYSGANNGSYIDKYDKRLGTVREVDPYPWFYSGEPSRDIRERWQWTFPIIFSPVDHKTLYTSSQRLWASTDGGETWKALSGDLTRHDPKTMGPSGGPITHDMNGPEVYATIFAVGPGKKDINVIWTGSDDGLIYVTRDGGQHWTNVTPKDMPDFGRVSQIDASSFDDGGAYVAVKRPLLNDRAPYIFRTKDYGQTWTRTVTGIPADDYVHAVREDPTRQGLLYAATQHGVYISYDDGDSWQDLHLNMPDVPVVDLVVEKNQLVIATHGRGFWVLDNIAPLRQATPGMTMAAAKLFAPPVAVRSGTGVTFSWWLADKANAEKLEVLDSVGAVLRTFVPDTTHPDTTRESSGFRRFGGGPWLSDKAGLNTLSWDLRTEPWVSFPGMIFWGARPMGPAVPPGRYTVRLTADGHTVTAPLTVVRNPWITDVSDADLHAQYEFGRMVRDRVNDANNAVIAIRRVKAQLQDRYGHSKDGRLRRAGDKLDTDASAVEAQIYQVKNESGQDPLNFPIRVDNRLANLLAMSERGDGRPNNNMPEIYGIMSNTLKGYLDRLQQIWATELPAVNRELARLKLQPLDPKCGNAAGCPAM
jgi:photosystem II stability/assembly factor-like uncharacterized protein